MPDRNYEGTPRPIIHDGINKGEKFGRIYTFAIAPMNEYLLDRERRLFLYYAACKSGFAPSTKEIARQTRINVRKVYSIRKALAQKQFISFEADRGEEDLAIHIRWDNIKRLAAQLRDADHDRKPNPPAKLAGITDKVRKEATYLPTIGEINREGFSLLRDDLSEEALPPLTESELRQVRACESLNVVQFHDVVGNLARQQLPF